MSIVRHIWGTNDHRWWVVTEDMREPGIVQVRPAEGKGARSRPTIVTSLEAAMDYINKQEPRGGKHGKR